MYIGAEMNWSKNIGKSKYKLKDQYTINQSIDDHNIIKY